MADDLIMLRAADNSLIECVRAVDGTMTITPEVLDANGEWVRGDATVVPPAAPIDAVIIDALPVKAEGALEAFQDGAEMATGEVVEIVEAVPSTEVVPSHG